MVVRNKQPVGNFSVRLVRGPDRSDVDEELTSSDALLKNNQQRPTVLSFYNDGWGGCRPVAAQMRRWATTIPDVQFLEVCVVDVSVALSFHRTYGFGRNPPPPAKEDNDNDEEDEREPVVVNGWVPSGRYMPVGYGQLGCSGFVVADSNGNFVAKRTPAYLDYGEQAFRHVESILSDLLASVEPTDGEAPSSTAMERGAGAPNPESKKRRKPTTSVSPQLRFEVGDAVEANVGRFQRGTIIKLWDQGNAYRIRLDGPDGVEVWAPMDSDNFVRAAVPTETRKDAAGSSSPTTVTTEIQAPSSVGVDSMDVEHQICTDSFNRALKDPTIDTLTEVYEILGAHFAHEEELIAKYAVADREQLDSPFSAFASHRKDHQRMLSMATRELTRVFQWHAASKAPSSADGGGGGCDVDENGVVQS